MADEMKGLPSSVRAEEEDQAERYGNDDLLSGSHEERNEYREETAADFAAPKPRSNRARQTNEPYAIAGDETGGRGLGITALIVSILSLFIWPVLMGIAGIIIGFIARGKGAKSLGTWAIIIGALSIVIGIFILPFF